MKILRKVVLSLGALLILVVVAAAVFFGLIFDPNDFRDRIAGLVEQETGRTLQIEGELDVQYFPWLGFDVGRTTLGDDPAFGDEPFIELDSASARVKVLPLLSRRLEIGGVTVTGLKARLIRNEQGVDNFQSLIDRLAGDGAPAEQPPAEGGAGLTSEGIGSVTIADAAITLQDRQAGTTTVLSDVDLETGSIVPGKPIDVTGGFDITQSKGSLEARIGVSGQVVRDGDVFTVSGPQLTVEGSNDPATGSVPFGTFQLTLVSPEISSDGEQHRVGSPRLEFTGRDGAPALASLDAALTADDLTMAGDAVTLAAPDARLTAEGESLPAGTQASLRADSITANLQAQTLAVSNYTLQALDVNASGSLNGSNILDAPELRGPVTLQQFSPRALLKKLDVGIETADPQALASLSGKANLAIGKRAQRLTDMDLKLDDSRIRGAAGISNANTGAKSFDLTIDQINLDRYLAPGAKPEDGDGSAADAVQIPAETLRKLILDGSLKVGQLVFSGIESRDVEVGVKANAGDIRVNPSRAKLYGGSYSGDIRIDAKGEVPVLSVNEYVRDIDFGAFAGTVMENNPLQGTVTGRVILEGRGHNTVEIRESLNGRASFAFADGVVQGIDVMEVLNGIVALANRTTPARTTGPKQTEFRKLAGDARVTDGVVSTNNLTVEAAALRVNGQGSVDLNTRALDFGIEARIVEAEGVELSPDLQKAVGYKIPLFIGGTYDAPKPAQLDRSVASLVGQFGKNKLLDKLFDKDKDEEGQEASVEGEQADEEPKDLEDELEDAAKSLLKDLLGGGG